MQPARIWQHGGKQGALLRRQLRGRAAEVAFAGRTGTIDAVTELGDVEIDLDDALLWPEQLDEGGEIGFQALAHETAAIPQEQVLRHLLADRAGTAQPRAVLGIGQRGLDRIDIEAMVVREFLVFGCDQGDRQIRGNLGQRRPSIAQGEILLTLEQGFHAALDHEGRGQRWHEAQEQHEQHARGDPQQQGKAQPAEDAAGQGSSRQLSGIHAADCAIRALPGNPGKENGRGFPRPSCVVAACGSGLTVACTCRPGLPARIRRRRCDRCSGGFHR